MRQDTRFFIILGSQNEAIFACFSTPRSIKNALSFETSFDVDFGCFQAPSKLEKYGFTEGKQRFFNINFFAPEHPPGRFSMPK